MARRTNDWGSSGWVGWGPDGADGKDLATVDATTDIALAPTTGVAAYPHWIAATAAPIQQPIDDGIYDGATEISTAYNYDGEPHQPWPNFHDHVPYHFGSPYWFRQPYGSFPNTAHSQVEQQLTAVVQAIAPLTYWAHGQDSQRVEHVWEPWWCAPVSFNPRGDRFAYQPLQCDQLQYQEQHYIVVWNVAPSTTTSTLADELVEVDFLPMDLIQLDGCKDAFLLVYDDEMDAKVVCTALDDTSGYIRDSGLGTIRLVKFGGPWHDGIPAAISASAQVLISRRRARDESGQGMAQIAN